MSTSLHGRHSFDTVGHHKTDTWTNHGTRLQHIDPAVDTCSISPPLLLRRLFVSFSPSWVSTSAPATRVWSVLSPVSFLFAACGFVCGTVTPVSYRCRTPATTSQPPSTVRSKAPQVIQCLFSGCMLRFRKYPAEGVWVGGRLGGGRLLRMPFALKVQSFLKVN